jgi:catechol-2,3-dioxygenase
MAEESKVEKSVNGQLMTCYYEQVQCNIHDNANTASYYVNILGLVLMNINKPLI